MSDDQTRPADDASSSGPNRAQKMNKKDKLRRQMLRELGMGKRPIVVEIGVWRGRFSKILLKELQPQTLYLIDPWAHEAKGPSDDAFTAMNDPLQLERYHRGVLNKFKKEIEADQVVVLRDYSVPALSGFGDDSIDLAYVDADHSYDAVAADIRALFPKIRFGGFMVFDDYHKMGWWGDDVMRALHDFIGAHASQIRINAVIGGQMVIRKLPKD